VCNGFVGNIVLKSVEGLGRSVRSMLREELTANPLRRLGAGLARGGLRRIAERMNPDTYGGAPFLGLRGCVVKIHGGARRMSLMHAMRQTARFLHLNLNDRIVAELAAVKTLAESNPTELSGTSQGHTSPISSSVDRGAGEEMPVRPSTS
jgi:phosphate acyltransferase